MRIIETFIKTSLVALTSSMAAFAQTGAPPPVPPPNGANQAMPAPGTTPYQPQQQQQQPPSAYPPAPSYGQPPPAAAYPQQGAPMPMQPTPAAAPQPGPAPQPGQPGQPATAAPMTVDVNATGSASMAPPPASPQEQSKDEAPSSTPPESDRDYTYYRHNSLSGATGLLHTVSADASAPGTFRLSILSNYYSGSGFLCQNRASCQNPPNSVGASETQDSIDRVGADLTLSATVLPFLEAYAGMHSHATSDNFGNPQLLQVLGDTNLGLKGFLPRQPDNIFSFGALGDLRLLNGSGSVGVHTANVSFRALGTLDLSNRQDPQQRIPFRLHANLGYLFENSSSIVESTEAARGRRITRIERFGLDINRVDTVFIGLGAEYVSPVVQPFAEWSIDIPSNRQSYTCRPTQVSQFSPGDSCMKLNGGFGATPSRLTFGLRTTPWLKGFNATLALDVGTGGTSKFIEELAPQVPWNLYFGIGFAFDTLLTSAPPPAPPAAPQIVQLPPPPERHIVGVVIDEKSLQPIPNAIIRFPGRTLTGLITRADGSFETGNLENGDYSLSVTAEGYKEGSCAATISPTTGAPGAMQPMNAPAGGTGSGFGVDQNSGLGQTGQQPPNAWNNPATSQPAPAGAGPLGTQGATITSIQCILKPAPLVGIIQGTLVDSDASSPVPGARITVRDSRGREVEVQTDDAGNFRFENVPAGTVHLSVDANGYLPTATDVEVKQKGEQRASLTLNKRPKKSSVSIVGKELKLASQFHFGTNSANILPDSQALLQEVAALLAQHSEVRRIEIQGHTDDSGQSAHNKRLSQDRAEAVRSALISLGVEASRLTAVGYGSEKPLVPNANEASRAKNRRVQLLILERQ